ncbi:MAG: TraB/GumN family protein [Myxococcota bacterium]
MDVNLLIVQQFFPESPPMDLTLADEAKKHGLAMDYLETVEEQFQMLSQLPEAYSIQGLEQSVLETDTLREEIRIMLESYRAGDAARLEELIVNNDAFNTWPKARDTMLMDRNARWVPQIEAYIQQGNVFIAVGLGHLVGDGSVIDRLNKRGHTVRRVAL